MAACRPGPGSAPPDGLSEPGDGPPTALVSRGAMVRGAWWARARARGVMPSLHFGGSAWERQVRGGASVAAGRHPLIQRILVGSVTARGRVTADDDSWLEAQSSDSDFDGDSE